MSGLLGSRPPAGGLPASIFEGAGPVPLLQSAMSGTGGPGPGFGAFTNPFTAPAAQPRPPSTNPFQPNGLATGLTFGVSSAGPGFPLAGPPGGAFSSTFAPVPFPPQASLVPQQNSSSFGDLGTAKLGQRPLGQPSISTNPFMTGPSSSPFASKPPTTNPFL